MHLEPLLGSDTGYTLGTRVLVRREANSVFIGGDAWSNEVFKQFGDSSISVLRTQVTK